MKLLTVLCLTGALFPVVAAEYLPPVPAWQGKSIALLQSNHPWVTPAETTALLDSPDYAATMAYVKKLVASSPLLQLEVIGKSPQGRDIYMVKASQQMAKIGTGSTPTVLVQAGIHSGEIDGKDAGLMLLRDIVHGDKAALLAGVDLLFIPILSVDGHERRGAFNRMNQRGPLEQGWRTTAQNLNLNRDYAKLDSLELRAVLQVINQYQPDLYLDIHVTDGEDYQYDITYGFNEPFASLSPNSATWLAKVYRPAIDKALERQGHIPGPLVFGIDSMDFSKGIHGWTATPRFSSGYGDTRHLPTILIENHSLKPFKQRVLGTYVLLEQTLRLLNEQGKVLQLAKQADRNARVQSQTLSFKTAEKAEPIAFKGISYQQVKSPITQQTYVQWTGKPKEYPELPVFWDKVPAVTVEVPTAYWIPPQYQDVITRLALHGIEMTTLTQPKVMELQQLVADQYEFASKPVEGRFTVSAQFSSQWQQVELPAGTVRISTDQALGRLAVALLSPQGPDSFFSWGFFHGMFERTEYFEPYALLPWIEQQLAQDERLQQQFTAAKQADASLAKDGEKIMQWFYQRSPFYDQHYLKYPVLLER